MLALGNLLIEEPIHSHQVPSTERGLLCAAAHAGVRSRLGKEAGLLLLALSPTSERLLLSTVEHATSAWHDLSTVN